MNAAELRIGNIINLQDKPCIVNLTTFERILYPNLSVNIRFREQYNPIPLSEVWLNKFGFIKKINSGSEYLRYYWNGAIMIYVDEDTHDFYLGDYDEYQDCKPFGLSEQKIQYVHQLQNLTFLLTGEELTIK